MLIPLPENVAKSIDNFTGRAWLLGKILDWYDAGTDRLMLLTGKPGTGKSMVSAWLAGYGPEPAPDADRVSLRRLRQAIRGTHFCVVNSLDNSPKGMADNLARQLVGRLPNFDQFLKAWMGNNVTININMQSGAIYGTQIGLSVGKLDLSNFLEEPGFQAALLQPLDKYYAPGAGVPPEPTILLIDALDEAALFGGRFKILHAIESLLKLQVPLRIVATVRDTTDLPPAFAAATRLDLILDAPPSSNDVAGYVATRLKGCGNGTLAQLGQTVVERAQGNFLFAHVVLEDLLARIAHGEQPALEDVPHELADHYQGFLRRLTNDDIQVWRRDLRPIIGVTAIAQNPGVKLGTVTKVVKQRRSLVLDTLQACKQYLNGEFNDTQIDDSGPFTVFHKSFADFLLDTEHNVRFYVDAVEVHQSLAQYYWPEETTSPDWLAWDEYGVRFMPTHLAAASATADLDQRHAIVQRLIDLVTDRAYWQQVEAVTHDLGQLERILTLSFETACSDLKPEALPLIIRAAQARLGFRRRIQQARPVFRLAAGGDVTAALLRLTYLPAEPHWRNAAELLIAWQAAACGGPAALHAAQDLYERVQARRGNIMPLPVLARRLAAAWGKPHPRLLPLPDAPPRDILEAVVYRLHSDKVQRGLLDSYIEYASWQVQKTATVFETDETPVRLAGLDGPVLVAYASRQPHPPDSDRFFLAYLRIMAGNQYRPYRNLALWQLLDAVLRHPDPDWARQALVRVVSAALAPQGAEFSETLDLVLMGLRARLGDAATVALLDQRRQRAQAQIDMLREERGKSDVTGAHKRRLTALALAYSLLPDGLGTADGLLHRACYMPGGYAGFLAPAFLNLADTMQVVNLAPFPVGEALHQALTYAHHIQDGAFCAQTTARVRTLETRWTPPPAGDLEALVRRFRHDPQAPEFAPYHQVGEDFHYRTQREDEMALPPQLLSARTLRDIALTMQLDLGELVALNLTKGWKEDTYLNNTEQVALPDRGFAPWLAARLSAHIAASPLSTPEKQELIQLLVPLAFGDRTVLDTVLAYLLYTVQPQDLTVLAACEVDFEGAKL